MGQPRRDYLDSVTPRVKNYIETEFPKFDIDDFPCCNEFHLRFNKEGEIKSISVANQSKPSLKSSLGISDYLADKKIIRKSKKKIKQAVKSKDFSQFQLKYDFTVNVMIINNFLRVNGNLH